MKSTNSTKEFTKPKKRKAMRISIIKHPVENNHCGMIIWNSHSNIRTNKQLPSSSSFDIAMLDVVIIGG